MEKKLGPLPPILEIEQSLAKFNYKAINQCYFSKALWRMDPLVAVLCARGILSFSKLMEETPIYNGSRILDVSIATKEKINKILVTRFFVYGDNLARYISAINTATSIIYFRYPAGGDIDRDVAPRAYGTYLANHFKLRNFLNDIPEEDVPRDNSDE